MQSDDFGRLGKAIFAQLQMIATSAKHVFSTLKIEKCSGNKNPRYFCLLDYPTVTHINLTELIDQLIPNSIYTVRRLKEVFYGGLVCTELGFSFRSVLQQAE